MCPTYAYENHSRTAQDQEETTPTNMEARLAEMEQLVERLTTQVGVLREENQVLKDTTQEPRNDEEPSNNEHHGSRNAGEDGDANEEVDHAERTL